MEDNVPEINNDHNKKRGKYIIIFIVCIFFVVLSVQTITNIQGTDWYRIKNGELIILNADFESITAFERNQEVIEELEEKCDFSDTAMFLVEGIEETFLVNAQGYNTERHPLESFYIYDDNRVYHVETQVTQEEQAETHRYRVEVVDFDVSRYNMIPLKGYIELLDKINMETISSEIGTDYYSISIVEGFNVVTEGDGDPEGALCYLYNNGTYERVEWVPEGSYYGVYFMGGTYSNGSGSFSQKDGYGYLLIEYEDMQPSTGSTLKLDKE